MEYRKLGNTGMEVSVLSFGASSLGGVFEQVNPDQCIKTVRAALDGGVNFIDVAPAYGETLAEINLGRALRGLRRDQYYLATKVGAYSEAKGDYDYSAERSERSLQAGRR
jgi:L-galactose dehydrogenase